ncbi:MAG: lamin tail domain-containing protein [Chloroflexi bacterium]|nr:lamin tail domain-containing protein [Chloroflexota bacterium]
MKTWQRFPRLLLVLTLLIAICAGMFAPRLETVEAKPQQAVDELSVFISEFRTRGPDGADDEFIEIYNASGADVDIGDWEIQKSSGCGLTLASLAVIPTGTILVPGQYYLIGKSGVGGYSGSTALDLSYSVTGISDDGGVALFDDSVPPVLIDQVGLCADTGFLEGTALSPLSGTADQSYERKTGGSAGSCKDTDNNAADFALSVPSNPQNIASPAVPCLAVVSAASATPDGVYLDTSGQVIEVDLTFSNIVDVTGTPTLLMETGATDRVATYTSGSGSDTLKFVFTVGAGDNTSDLDYASVNALSLNGGTISGASGDAVLLLPRPNEPGSGSLSDNADIRIDNTSTTPSLVSFTRQNPTSQYTKASNGLLVFRITFSEAVLGVDEFDFDTDDSPVLASLNFLPIVNVEGGRVYDLTVEDTNLSTYDGTIGLNLNAPAISDVNGAPLALVEPTTDQAYIVDNTQATVTIEQGALQVDPVITPGDDLPIDFDVAFDDPIDASTFTALDIKQNGNATGITWSITNSGDNTNFTLSAIVSGSGTLEPSIDANKVKDLAWNDNLASISVDNSVTYFDTTPPTVTINQAASQVDPSQTLPIRFTVLFSEVINTATFTTADITQTGTATGVTWSITDSGDHKTFTLSAITASGFGTVIPIMAANRVTDLSGNNNSPSTSADNSVNYVFVPTSTPTATFTVTPTPTGTALRRIVINEVAWAGTGSSTLTSDEWIELYNPGSTSINLTGWTIKDSSSTISLTGVIPAGGYFLLEHDDDTTVSDIAADQVYTTIELNNSGETLTLYDPANKAIDTANGNGGSWPAGSASTYGTMERAGISSESDSTWMTNTGIKKNGKAANGTDILGTPKAGNTPVPTATPTRVPTATITPIPPTAKIDPRPIINEILPRPGFDWNQDGKADVFDEFIEIKNLSPIDISLNGWRLDKVGATAFNLPNVTLKPGQHIVFYSAETKLLLSDGGETVRLFNPSGKIFDAYTYTVARAEDKSICRLPDGNVYNGWFEDCTPTPNLTNTRDGKVPSAPDGSGSPVCELPDTIPGDFFYAECRGFGAGIWNPYYWDQLFPLDKKWLQQNTSKWQTFIE